MTFSRILPLLLVCAMLATAANAQDQSQSPYPPQKPSAQHPASPVPDLPAAAPPYTAQPAPPPPYATAPPADTRQWLPQGIATLGQFAATRTEFNIDHSMLALASKFDRDNQDLQRVIAGVSGVAVHSFHFPGGVSIDPLTMSSIAQEYREAGFQHLVSKHRGENGFTTDLWLRMDGAAIRDIAVLWEGNRDLNFISVSGSITPLDLLHLSGHFGIPKMDGGAVVPALSR
jgi:hypothetical protein